LPARGRLARNENNLPEFSFLQYNQKKVQNNLSGASITEADGGGLVHFLALYDTPDQQVQKAEKALKRKLKREDIILSGPVNFREGNYLLVSSVLRNGKAEKEIIGIDKAPVFQNSKVPFSTLLDPLGAQLLMESFQMATPDISLTFDLVFEGLTKAYEAELIINWSMIEEAEYSKESRDAIFFSSDVEKTLGNMMRTGAVQLRTAGRDSIADQLLQVAYDKLLQMMYEPVQPRELPKEKTRGVLNEIFGARGILGGLVGGSNVYKKRTLKTSGQTVVNLNTRVSVQRNHLITFNIGDMYKKYGDDPLVFKKVSLDDPVYKQREILVNLDGALSSEFEAMISSIGVLFRKKHQNGAETIEEPVITAHLLQESDKNIKIVYLNKGDTDRLRWLDYEYQVKWQFLKDGSYDTPWISSNAPVLNLYVPYENQIIDVFGEHDVLKEAGVMVVTVNIEYPFFGKTKRERLKIRVGESDKSYQLNTIVPKGQTAVDYRIVWHYKDGSKKERKGKDEYGFLLIDELPN
ncbi:MAG: hypothetical protein AAGJ18_02500, partial [Bacteroidota bacterium]